MSSSVLTANPFDLLDDEPAAPSAGASSTSNQTKKPTEQKVGAKKAANQLAAATASSSSSSSAPSSSAPSRGGSSQRGKFFEAAHMAPRENHSDRGRRGGHPPRGRGGFSEPSQKREFDRRGAPQRHAPGASNKGGHGLGPQGEVQEPKDAVGKDATEAAAAAEGSDQPAAEGEDTRHHQAPVEEDDGTVTLDQYYEKQKAKAVAEDQDKKIREVKIDEKVWGTAKVLNASKTATEEEKKEKPQGKETKGEGKSKKQTISLDEFNGPNANTHQRKEYNSDNANGNYHNRDSNNGGGYRGGRGRGAFRGSDRGGRGGGRGGAANVINTNDDTAFPKLGK